METVLQIKFDSIAAAIHVICIVAQIWILYSLNNSLRAKYSSNNQGGYRQ